MVYILLWAVGAALTPALAVSLLWDDLIIVPETDELTGLPTGRTVVSLKARQNVAGTILVSSLLWPLMLGLLAFGDVARVTDRVLKFVRSRRNPQNPAGPT